MSNRRETTVYFEDILVQKCTLPAISDEQNQFVPTLDTILEAKEDQETLDTIPEPKENQETFADWDIVE